MVTYIKQRETSHLHSLPDLFSLSLYHFVSNFFLSYHVVSFFLCLFFSFSLLDERGLNSLEILSFLAMGHRLTGNTQFKVAFDFLWDQNEYGTNALNQKINTAVSIYLFT